MRAGVAAPLSLTARFALIFALFAGSVLLIVGMIIERAIATHFDELDEHDLAAQVTVVVSMLARTTSATQFDALRERLDDALLGHGMVAVMLRDDTGNDIYTIREEVFGARPPRATPGHEASKWTWDGRQYIGHDTVIQIPLAPLRPVQVFVALDITHHVHFLTEVRYKLWLAIGLVALLAAALGWFAASRGLRPLSKVTATARRLSAERLGERLSEKDAPPEILELVAAFNGMLDRLEGAFARLNQYSADIAHELRTPVSNLMTETEVALSHARTADEYRETLHSNLEEFERLARMISDMLFLAKADNGMLPRPAETIALHDEALALLEFYEALAQEQRVAVQLHGRATVTGNRLMLRRAVSNLLSNALRHTAAGGAIDIRIRGDSREVSLSVINSGDVIPPEQFPLLFERFYRADSIRTRHGEGAGLGLAITRSIVEAHGGRVGVASVDGKTSFTLYLPPGAGSNDASS